MMDSDGDGMTNGAELGDPDCTWTPGTAPKFSAGLSHPGVCEPLDDPKCGGQNDFVDCSSQGFKCSAINETGELILQTLPLIKAYNLHHVHGRHTCMSKLIPGPPRFRRFSRNAPKS